MIKTSTSTYSFVNYIDFDFYVSYVPVKPDMTTMAQTNVNNVNVAEFEPTNIPTI